MATRKTTKPKSEKSAPRTRKKAEPAPEVQESAGLSRAAWGAIWAGLGVLTLLALLPIDGALLRQTGTLVVLCVSDDTAAATSIVEGYLK